MPRPYQKPHPPIWIAAISSEESFTWPGRQGYNLMIVPYAGGLERTSNFVKAYRQAWRESGHEPGKEQVQMSFHCYIAETRDEAIEGYQRPMTTYLEVFTEAVSGWKNTSSLSYPGYDKLVSAIASQTWKTNLDNRTAFVGTPDDVVEHINYLRGLFGEMEPSMQVTFGNISEAEAMRTIELFAKYVMPHFKTSAQEAASAPAVG